MKFTTDSEEYILSISKDKENDNELLFTLSMKQNMSFWQRLRFYIKYLFGYRCRYGDFDCLTVSKKNIEIIMLRVYGKQ